ncbi:MAG: DUF362 domain-containing protein [Bacteroidota bacterium]|nr:DUF362 domain-containing protein [Bacteroidota bacterium]
MKDTPLSRREFLERTSKAAGLAAFASLGAVFLHEAERHPFAEDEATVLQRDLRTGDMRTGDMRTGDGGPRLAIVHGDDPAAMTAAALAAMGGIDAHVSPGDFVVVKPNIGWDRRPEQAANTNPAVVGEIVRQCVAAGASRVVVTDVTCNDATRCFNRSGIAAAAREAGAEIQLPQEAHFREVNMGGHMLGTQMVYDVYLEADKFINVPIAKHHSLTRVTLGMKNLYGILGGNRSRLHQEIDQSICDLATFLQPTLIVLDATRVLLRNGPQGGSLADVEARNMLVISNDQVALDACGGELFFNLSAMDMPWLALAEKQGLGSPSWRDIPYDEITL